MKLRMTKGEIPPHLLKYFRPVGHKPKDRINIPHMFADAMREDGWTLRDEVVWCLSSSTRVYAKTQKGEMPTTIHDLVRLDPTTVKLWNGQKWTQVLGWGPTRCDEPVKLVLRSGERINCTPNHEWPLADGRVVKASELTVGDVLATCELPEPAETVGDGIGEDLAWFAGLYLAEGSMSDDAIQIAGNINETGRIAKVEAIAQKYGGSAVVHNHTGNCSNQVVHGAILRGAIQHFVAGRTAKDKHLHTRAWKASNALLWAFLSGYLAGDGHKDPTNDRYRLGFTRNNLWADDLRTLAARLGCTLTLKPSYTKCGRTKVFESYRGELRFEKTTHHNTKQRAEIVEIKKSIAGDFWDIAVADEPHLFALASGVLTHNCKPNPMPSSTTDRTTCAHEFLFMFSKKARYFYDAEAIKEKATTAGQKIKMADGWDTGPGGHGAFHRDGREKGKQAGGVQADTRNCRSVWRIEEPLVKLRDDLTPEQKTAVLQELVARGLI